VAGIYRLAPGVLSAAPSGVIALDRDKVLGRVPGVVLFWTPTDLATFAGIRGMRDASGPIAAGYHLFRNGEEIDMTTSLQMGSEIHD